MTPWIRTRRAGTFDEYRRILTTLFEMAGGTSCIDLGCGQAHVTQHFPGALLVDLVPKLNPHRPVWKIDMRELPSRLGVQRFDLVLMTDSLEHLTKGDGDRVLREMRLRCNAEVVFVPVGPWQLQPSSEEPDAHKSAWFPEEFSEKGWNVWEWPAYHQYENGRVLGAFWAWSFNGGGPLVAEVAARAKVEIEP